ncbi:MAG: diguanylate cyclase response regulator [Epsilonproteobacteria bacterium]|nr:MAG: diguanylate cyclase response regulator [Campylobacterota bacterium]
MKSKSNILIVDDTPTNIEILVDLLGDYNIAVSLDGQGAIDISKNSSIDLILLDIMMPELDGFEVCKQLKLDPKTKDIPIIFITAKTDEESIENAYNAGGVDYVTKPFKPREVCARVKVHMEHSEHMKRLDYLASYDAMTDVYNRRKFFELGEDIFKHTKENELFAVILDIDHFKRVNDNYGHPAGDMVIREIAQVVYNILDDNMIFGRIGGEEFAILLHTTKDAAIKITEACRKAVEELSIMYNSINLHCTMSTGMACKSKEVDTLDLLLAKADEALYEAKDNGRNQLIFRS